MNGALVVQGNALRLPLPDESVDLIVTSPPYFALRAYDGDHPAMVGSEPTPREYLEALWAATAEMARVLKPSGSIFCDLGDKYGRPGGGADVAERTLNGAGRGTTQRLSTPAGVGRDKCLMLLPERYRIGCIDHLNLIARAVIVWQKPNGLPESVTDRVRRSHEDWVHLVKQPRYYAAVDEVREPHSLQWGPIDRVRGRRNVTPDGTPDGGMVERPNPLGKLPGSVWQIPSEPLHLPDHLGVNHYAAFPSEWPRRLILGWSPPGICLACGEGRWPVVDRKPMEWRESPTIAGRTQPNGSRRPASGTMLAPAEATILGYACACTPHTNHPGTGEPSGPTYAESIATIGYPDAGTNDNGRGHTSLQNRPKVGPWREYHLTGWTPPPTRPSVVLDPFAGTGTVPMVARALGRTGIGVDLSHPYCRAARWRIRHDAGKAITRTNLERQGSLL